MLPSTPIKRIAKETSAPHAKPPARAQTEEFQAPISAGGALTPRAASQELMALLERAGPYGQGNPQPRFAFAAHVVKFAKVVGEALRQAAARPGASPSTPSRRWNESARNVSRSCGSSSETW